MEKGTALHAFKQLLPTILAWKPGKQSLGLNMFIIAPDFIIGADGKRSTWSVLVFSPIANQSQNFSFPETFPENQPQGVALKLSPNKKTELARLQGYHLLDSDWAVQKALELGLPADTNNNLQAHLAGQVAWSEATGHWKFTYYKNELEEWELSLSMLDGQILSHKYARTRAANFP